MKFGVSGQFQLQVEGGMATEWFDNLITDSGLSQIAIGEYLTWCALGTGSTAPTPNDTALDTLLVTTDNLTASTVASGQYTVVFVFPKGTATGLIAEVGIGWNLEGTPLFSRAVLPEALEVKASQGLTVTYVLTLTPPVVDDVYLLDLNGTATTCTSRAAYVGNAADWAWGLSGQQVAFITATPHQPQVYDGPIDVVTAYPTGTAAAATSASTTLFDPAEPHSAWLTAKWAMGAGGFVGGIDATLVCTNGYGAYQIGFDPPLAKQHFDVLCLTYQLSWSRVA